MDREKKYRELVALVAGGTIPPAPIVEAALKLAHRSPLELLRDVVAARPLAPSSPARCECGGRLVVRSSTWVGAAKVRYLRCKSCGKRAKATSFV